MVAQLSNTNAGVEEDSAQPLQDTTQEGSLCVLQGS
jgi:hypothetical protein